MTKVSRPTIFTIGHSNHSIDYFISLLTAHKITAVADVRSSPYSKRYSHFSQDRLKRHLKEAGIAYVYLGKELGGRGRNDDEYINGRVSYTALGKTPRFRTGLRRIRKGSASYAIALLCSEADPMQCHRGILIAPELVKAGFRVNHILPDGNLETHDQLEQRLLTKHRLHSQALFFSYPEILRKAYDKQAELIAYTKVERK